MARSGCYRWQDAAWVKTACIETQALKKRAHRAPAGYGGVGTVVGYTKRMVVAGRAGGRRGIGWRQTADGRLSVTPPAPSGADLAPHSDAAVPLARIKRCDGCQRARLRRASGTPRWFEAACSDSISTLYQRSSRVVIIKVSRCINLLWYGQHQNGVSAPAGAELRRRASPAVWNMGTGKHWFSAEKRR